MFFISGKVGDCFFWLRGMDYLQKRCTADVILYFCSISAHFCISVVFWEIVALVLLIHVFFPCGFGTEIRELLLNTRHNPPPVISTPTFFFRVFATCFSPNIDVLVLRELVSEAKGTFRRPNTLLNK